MEEIEENDFIELPMTARHALAAATLPRHHDDPGKPGAWCTHAPGFSRLTT